MKKNIISFDDFINPHGNLKRFKNKNIDFYDLEYCSFVKYLIIEHINGEIENNYFILDHTDLFIDFQKKMFNYYIGPYFIFAINYLDNIVCEVI